MAKRGRKPKVKVDNEKIAKAIKERKEHKARVKAEKLATQEPQGDKTDNQVVIDAQAKKGETRATLMKQAQAQGIKYFRILTKEELTEVLATDGAGTDRKSVV